MTTSRERIVEIMAEAMLPRYLMASDSIADAAHVLAALSRAGYKIVSGEPVAWISPLELQKLKAYGSAIVTPTFKSGLNGHTPLYRESEAA